MIRPILLLCFLLTSSLFADDKLELKEAAYNYLSAIVKRDKVLYKQSTSDKFYSNQVKAGFLKTVLSQPIKTKKEVVFDMKVQKGAVDKDFYFINIKEKEIKNYGDTWLIVRKEKGRFLIDGLHHFED